ncbi:MAG: diguanylate cyclase [Proteobacteria bacterium]|nr:diguanylate cyclase [Pseudomonadota bacterium]MBU1736553.1 diguanylate cyclase [Pseudomonadota bacterium]
MTRILVAAREGLIPAECLVLLETRGYQPIFPESLKETVSVILEDPPDLLIVDMAFAGGGYREVIRVASSCLQKANMPILLIINDKVLPAIRWDELPVDDILVEPLNPDEVVSRIMLAESRMARVFDNNPLSKLPGNTSIIRMIQKNLDSGRNYGVCYLDIDNFKPYNDRYGFAQGDDVILMVARLIVNVVEEIAREDSFVGHVGGDDYVFIVPREKVEKVCERLLANFSVVRNMFLSAEDLEAGAFIGTDRLGKETRFELLSISVAVVVTGEGTEFRHFGEVVAAASQIKHFVKKQSGSNYLIDRRNSYHRNSTP